MGGQPVRLRLRRYCRLPPPHAAYRRRRRLIGFADLAINEFYRLTGLAETPVDPARTVAAYNAMTAA